MDIARWLTEAAQELAAADVATARLDSLVLLEDALGIDRARLLAHPELTLTDDQLALLQAQTGRRARHEPLAYIRGHAEFYGRTFIVNEHVLVPRPETESMIDLLKGIAPADLPGSFADIGTGSGAIAVTAALELPGYAVMATDTDEDCLKTARQNAAAHNVQISFYNGDLLAALPESTTPISALLCNLPYVPDAYEINRAATFEPGLALYGGADGLDLYRRLFAQLAGLRGTPEYILTEALPEQHAALRSLAIKHQCTELESSGFIQLFQYRTL